MVRAEVKMFAFSSQASRREQMMLLPKGWTPVNMETDGGTLYVYATKQRLVEPEEPTPGLKPDGTLTVKRTDAHVRRSPLAMPVKLKPRRLPEQFADYQRGHRDGHAEAVAAYEERLQAE
jgi:hypothetical protein